MCYICKPHQPEVFSTLVLSFCHFCFLNSICKQVINKMEQWSLCNGKVSCFLLALKMAPVVNIYFEPFIYSCKTSDSSTTWFSSTFQNALDSVSLTLRNNCTLYFLLNNFFLDICNNFNFTINLKVSTNWTILRIYSLLKKKKMVPYKKKKKENLYSYWYLYKTKSFFTF